MSQSKDSLNLLGDVINWVELLNIMWHLYDYYLTSLDYNPAHNPNIALLCKLLPKEHYKLPSASSVRVALKGSKYIQVSTSHLYLK